jgi:hypothetical protein
MTAAIMHRLILPLQRRGNLGKSTLISAAAQFCDHHSVAWQGYDLDPEHRSFSRLFPDQVTLRELIEEPEAECIRIARAATGSPVTLIDPRAHLSDALGRGFEMLRFPEEFAKAGGRLTVPLFPADDLEILTDIDSLVTNLGGSVDYLVVRNPARQPRTRMFTGSELEADLLRLGAAAIELPALLGVARNHLSALETDLGRGVTHTEAVANPDLALDGIVRLVIEDWLRNTFRRFGGVADLLLPTADAAKIRPVDTRPHCEAPRPMRGAKINRSNL